MAVLVAVVFFPRSVATTCRDNMGVAAREMVKGVKMLEDVISTGVLVG